MTPVELLTEKEYAFYEKFETKDLKNLSLEELDYINIISNNYIYDINSIIKNNSRMIVFQKMLYKLSREANDNLNFSIPVNDFKDRVSIHFNNLAEIFAFIILVIDPNFNIANKYLSFVEQSNSNIKGLLMFKKYAETYNYFFDTKILQAELILMEKQKELEQFKKDNKKRTIIG